MIDAAAAITQAIIEVLGWLIPAGRSEDEMATDSDEPDVPASFDGET